MVSKTEIYPRWVYPALEKIDAETVHNWTLTLLTLAQRSRLGIRILEWVCTVGKGKAVNERLKTQIGSISLDNPLILTAGFDKDGRVIPALERLGFGSIVAGTVTEYLQAKNARPRIFRPPTRAGTRAVGLYTSLVYLEPTLPIQLQRELSDWMEDQGVDTLDQLVGQRIL